MTALQDAILDPQVLARVLAAVADLNAEFLEALAESAKSRPEQFPLPQCLRSDFSRVLVSQCRERGRCGIFLADAFFADYPRWAHVVSGGNLDAFPQEHDHWLSIDQGVVVAHSVLMVAWHIVHAVPSLASILLGMSDEVVCEFVKLSISDLVSIARSRSSWLRPRWADRADVWASIMACGDPDLDQEPVTVLCCLKASATGSRRMLNSAQAGKPVEL